MYCYYAGLKEIHLKTVHVSLKYVTQEKEILKKQYDFLYRNHLYGGHGSKVSHSHKILFI